MSMDPGWILGYTYDKTITLTDDEARAAINAHADEIRARLDDIDMAGALSFAYGPEELDEEGRDSNGVDRIADALAGGYGIHRDLVDDCPEYYIPGNDNLLFAIRTEDYAETSDLHLLAVLLAAVDQLPELGAHIGILGGGIHTRWGA